MEHLAFRLEDAVYAVGIGPVEEVLPLLPIEPVPGMPPFLKGVMFVRGHIVPVLDAAERLRVRRQRPAPVDTHMIAFRIRSRLVALLVDEALDLVVLQEGNRVPAGEMYLPPGAFEGLVESEGQIYRLLNPDRLLSPEETAAVDEARGRAEASPS
jgi:purine-binding chemotaxis protein CheW